MPEFVKTQLAPGEFDLGPNDVHCWLADLEQFKGRLDELARLLDAEEQARAGRFRFEKDRDLFTLGRGLLRSLLGGYLGRPPGEIVFVYNEHGKPALGTPRPTPPLQFNVSHSHGLVLFGFTLEHNIGVDIERVRPEVAAEDLGKRFFATVEIAELNSVAGEDKRKAFFRGWARKEAFIKARGIGLSLGLDKFAVTLGEGPPAFLSIENGAPEQWTLRDCPVPEGFVGAVAVERPGSVVRFRSYPVSRSGAG